MSIKRRDEQCNPCGVYRAGNQEAFHFISSTLASILNRYVFTLGYAYIKNEDLPVVQDRKIFSTDIMLPEIEEEDVGMLSNPWSIYVSQLTMVRKEFLHCKCRTSIQYN